MSEVVYLSLGSNIGDRELHLREAIARLGEKGCVRAVSSFYETEPVEVTDQARFMNCAVRFDAAETAEELMAKLLRIEREMGRQRFQKKGPRTIDLDILLFGDVVIQKDDLKIPHPAMAQRRFVLQPLAELAPEVVHPVLKKTISELLAELPPGQAVWRIAAKPDDSGQ